VIGQETSWRWTFWINLPLLVPCIVGTIYALNLEMEHISYRKKFAQIDYLGITVFTGSCTSFLYGITTGGTQEPWKSGKVIAPLVIGVAGFIVFVLVEWRVAKKPMMPLSIYNGRTATAGYVGVFIHGLVLWSAAYYTIVYVSSQWHSRLQAQIIWQFTDMYYSSSAPNSMDVFIPHLRHYREAHSPRQQLSFPV
jgi:MFS family permease